jgi:cation transport ATPase
MEREEQRLREARKRAVIAGVLSIPVTIIAMADWKGAFWRWAQFVLSTPIVFWSGKPFFTKAIKLARQRSANMDSLIVLGVGAAYIYSTAALFFRRPYLYFDAASGIICFVLLGRYLEEKAKGRAHAARMACTVTATAPATDPARPQVPADLTDPRHDTCPPPGPVPARSCLAHVPGQHRRRPDAAGGGGHGQPPGTAEL